MKPLLLSATLLVLVLGACGDKQGDQASPAVASEPSAAPPAAPSRSNRINAEQLKAIAASGKTGLWSDADAVCQSRKQRTPVMIAWNVKDTGTKRVQVYMLGGSGKERRFGSGAAVGGKMTGTWVRPGSTFILRDADSEQELGKLVIAGKQC